MRTFRSKKYGPIKVVTSSNVNSTTYHLNKAISLDEFKVIAARYGEDVDCACSTDSPFRFINL